MTASSPGAGAATISTPTKLYELEDKTLGIIGLGNIGKKVARRAKAFDMRIQYYDVNRMTTDQEDALGVRFALFPELLKTSDYVSLHVPLDKTTHKLIGERELSMMKKTAILINTCRGPVVDEVALYQALRDETIMAAGIDVMVQEPPKPDHELFTLEERDLQPAFGRPDLGQPPEALAQRIRQLRARRARSACVLDRPRAARRDVKPDRHCEEPQGDEAISLGKGPRRHEIASPRSQ